MMRRVDCERMNVKSLQVDELLHNLCWQGEPSNSRWMAKDHPVVLLFGSNTFIAAGGLARAGLAQQLGERRRTFTDINVDGAADGMSSGHELSSLEMLQFEMNALQNQMMPEGEGGEPIQESARLTRLACAESVHQVGPAYDRRSMTSTEAELA